MVRDEKLKPVTDAVNHPKHYNTGKIEVIEFIEDQRLGLHLGNVVKYVCRAGRKDKATRIQDLEKAAWYLKRKIEVLKARRDRRDAKRPNDMADALAYAMGEHPNCRCATSFNPPYGAFKTATDHAVPGKAPSCTISISAKGISIDGELPEELCLATTLVHGKSS